MGNRQSHNSEICDTIGTSSSTVNNYQDQTSSRSNSIPTISSPPNRLKRSSKSSFSSSSNDQKRLPDPPSFIQHSNTMSSSSFNGASGGGPSTSQNRPATALKFNQVHGENVRLTNNGQTANRLNSFCKALAFSDRPIRTDEVICIKLPEVQTSWSGVLRVGVTQRDPMSFPELPKYVCPDMTSRPGTWAKALTERYCQEGHVLYFFVKPNGEMYYGVNGSLKGLFLTGIEIGQPLFVVIDIYGNTTSVEFVNETEMRRVTEAVRQRALQPNRDAQRNAQAQQVVQPPRPVNLPPPPSIPPPAVPSPVTTPIADNVPTELLIPDIPPPPPPTTQPGAPRVQSPTSAPSPTRVQPLISSRVSSIPCPLPPVRPLPIPENALAAHALTKTTLPVNPINSAAVPTSAPPPPPPPNAAVTASSMAEANSSAAIPRPPPISDRRQEVPDRFGSLARELEQRLQFNQQRTMINANAGGGGNNSNANNNNMPTTTGSTPNLPTGLRSGEQLGLRFNRASQIQPIYLHRVQGRNVQIEQCKTVAFRVPGEYCGGYVFTERPLGIREKIIVQIQRLAPDFGGGLACGATNCDPASLPENFQFPDDADELSKRPEWWSVSKDHEREPQLMDEFTYYINVDGEVVYQKNREQPRGLMHLDPSLPFWLFFDIYGRVDKIRVVGTTRMDGPVRGDRPATPPPPPPQPQPAVVIPHQNPQHRRRQQNPNQNQNRRGGGTQFPVDPARYGPPPSEMLRSFSNQYLFRQSSGGNNGAGGTSSTMHLPQATEANRRQDAAGTIHAIGPSTLTGQPMHQQQQPYGGGGQAYQRQPGGREFTNRGYQNAPPAPPNRPNRAPPPLPQRTNSGPTVQPAHQQQSSSNNMNHPNMPRPATSVELSNLSAGAASTSAPIAPNATAPTAAAPAAQGNDQGQQQQGGDVAGASTSSSSARTECTVCLDAPVNAAVYPCGHMCMCYECGRATWQRQGKCPICRADIRDILRIYV